MKRLLAVMMVVLMLVGCGSSLKFDKGQTKRYHDVTSDFEVTINTMELSGKELHFNTTIRNLYDKPLSLENSYFAVGWVNRADTDYSKGTLMPGESIIGNGTIENDWEKGKHEISFSTGFMSAADFEFEIK